MTEKQKEYYLKNREKILERQKAYNAAHKEEKKEYDRKRAMKRWREKADYNEKYYQEHRADIQAYYKNYYKRKIMKKLNLDEWKKERDAVVKTCDVEKFKKFYEKWTKKGFYSIELPPDHVLEISLRKMILDLESATEQEKADARWWLAKKGIKE